MSVFLSPHYVLKQVAYWKIQNLFILDKFNESFLYIRIAM